MKKHNAHGPKSERRGLPVRLFTLSHTVLETTFRAGEVYLFHRTDCRCPPTSSLWGQYAGQEHGRPCLESSTPDLHAFRLWHVLPADYRYCRRATRSELRDYVFASSWSEFRRLQPLAPRTGRRRRRKEDASKRANTE